MRICLFSLNYHPEHAGIAPYTTALAAGLAARGHDVQVLTALPHYPQWRVAVEHRALAGTVRAENGVVVRRFSHYVPRNPTTRNRIAFEASYGLKVATAQWGKPDLVLTMSPSLIATGLVVARARARRIPVGVIVQDLYGLGVVETGAMQGRMANAALTFESKVLRSATGISVIHDRFAAATKQMRLPEDQVTVIRNWTHKAHGDVRVDIASARKKFGWSPGEQIVLHTGNMGVKQGLENVVEAARLADARQLNMRFVLLGDGNQRGALQDLAEGVRRIEFKQPVGDDEYSEILAAADVLLLNERPGVGEMAVPSKLTSYFAAGRPVLAATDHNGVTADEVHNSNAGVVVQAGEPDALVAAALTLFDDPERGQALGRSGQEYARHMLSAQHALDQYEQWCRQLVAGGSRHRDV